MKIIGSVLGIALLTGALALTQTSSTGQKSSKSKTADTNPPSQGTSSASANPSSDTSGQASSSTQSGDTSPNQVKVGKSGFDDINSDKAGSATQNGHSGSAASPDSASSPPESSSRQSSSQSSSSTAAFSNGPVAETITDHSALIGWATHDAAGNMAVKYGTSRANLTETAQGTDGADGTNHHARLQGLQPNTHYYFQVTENGSPVGGLGTFKTTARGEAPVQSKAIIPQK